MHEKIKYILESTITDSKKNAVKYEFAQLHRKIIFDDT